MTPEDAAAWMLVELKKRRFLDQEIAAYELTKLDSSLTYENAAGNLALHKRVLTCFRKLMTDDVVWSRGERHWRFRLPSDSAGRMQD